MKPTLVVLAAGMGSRYGGLKQMDPVGPSGESILDYTVHDAARAGFGKAVFVIRPDFADLFRSSLGSHFERKLEVDYAFQELGRAPAWYSPPAGREKPWGTGHAVLMAEGLVDGPFAVVNADDFYGQRGFELLARRLESAQDGTRADYAMVGYALDATLSDHGTVSRGVCELAPDGRLASMTEYLKIARVPGGAVDQAGGRAFTGQETVSLNFFGFTPSIFGHLGRAFEAFLKVEANGFKGEFFAPAMVNTLVRDGIADMQVLRSPDPWYGITYREDRERVAAGIRALVEAGRYPANLRG